MTVRGRSIVVILVAGLFCLVGGTVFLGWCAWQEMEQYGPLPERPDIARAFAFAADQGQLSVALPAEEGVFLSAAPYVLTQEYFVSQFAIDRAHAARVLHANQAVESMHVYHIVDGRCAGHCTLDSRFDLCGSAHLVPAGQAVRLAWVDGSRPIVIRVTDTSAPPADSFPDTEPPSP